TADPVLDLGLPRDREFLVAWAEVGDASRPAVEAAAATKHLAALERTDEHELVRRRDVEELAVHLLLGDDNRLRHTLGDGVGRIHRPDQLALAGSTPPERAAGSNQPPEALGAMGGRQHDESHSFEVAGMREAHYVV